MDSSSRLYSKVVELNETLFIDKLLLVNGIDSLIFYIFMILSLNKQ